MVKWFTSFVYAFIFDIMHFINNNDTIREFSTQRSLDSSSLIMSNIIVRIKTNAEKSLEVILLLAE